MLAFSNDFLHVFSHLGGSTELPVELYRALSVGVVQHARGSTAAPCEKHQRLAPPPSRAAHRRRRRSMPPTLSEDAMASLALARALAHSGALRAGEGVAAEHGGGRRARAPARRRAPSCLCIYRKNSSTKEFLRIASYREPNSKPARATSGARRSPRSAPGPLRLLRRIGAAAAEFRQHLRAVKVVQ